MATVETPDFFRNLGGTLVAAPKVPSVQERTERQVAALDKPKFDGSTYVPRLDESRLKAQLVRVRELMRDGVWRSLSEISTLTDDPESSVSARLRDCRKIKHGMWTVERRRRSPGVFEYRFGGKGL
jgi:hypothetical protein